MDHHPAVADMWQQLQEGQMVHLSLVVGNTIEENRIYFPAKKLQLCSCLLERKFTTVTDCLDGTVCSEQDHSYTVNAHVPLSNALS